MDYSEARDAFFSPRPGEARDLGWTTPARRLRDAIEPLATIVFWGEPAYDALAARGLDFLSGYVWGRASSLGEPEASLVASAFGVFEPGLVASLYAAGRETCSIEEVRAARAEGTTESLRQVLGDSPEGLEDTLAALRAAVEAAPSLGRPFFSGLQDVPWPDHPLGQLWHVTTMLREHRGDSHLAACACQGLDGNEANLLTEAWIGWEPTAYAGSRAWTPESMQDAVQRLTDRGILADGQLTAAGKRFRDEIETVTDAQEQAIVDALGDRFDEVVARLEGWSQQVVEHGWFPPDPYKRAAG